VKVTLRYLAQVKQAAGHGVEVVELHPGCTLAELLAAQARQRSALASLLLTPEGRVQPALLLFVGDTQAGPETVLHDGADVTVLAPMAGG
jgi:molybdopterin converting factor small subunit